MDAARIPLGPLPALCAALIVLAGCSSTRVSRDEEVRLGQRTAAQIEQRYDTYADPALTRIGEELAAASERPELPWRFRVIAQPEVNAISLPGGPVYIYEGLLRRIGSDEGMLAAVLGHEIGHIEERHAARQIERSQWFGLGSSVLQAAIGGDAGAISQTAANLQLLSYGRRQEHDADDRAIRLMRRTNRDPAGLVRLLELLQRQGGGGASIGWLRTHPTSQARIDRVREKIRGA